MKSKALLVVFALSQLTCHQALFVAGPNTSMFCNANPPFIPADRGVSVITCHLTEDQTGAPVADGVVVQFFTDLGRIPEQGRTNDGVVRVNFESTGLSGTANIRAVSGGGSGGTTPTTIGPTSTTINVKQGFSASGGQVVADLAGIAAEGSTSVRIGNVVASRLLLFANPNRIVEGRTSEITANVVSTDGNPVSGVAVFFVVRESGGNPAAAESLDSQGQPVFTDTNGQARDTLRTRFPRDGGTRTVTVTAFTAGGLSDDENVTIN